MLLEAGCLILSQEGTHVRYAQVIIMNLKLIGTVLDLAVTLLLDANKVVFRNCCIIYIAHTCMHIHCHTSFFNLQEMLFVTLVTTSFVVVRSQVLVSAPSTTVVS